MDDGAQVDAVPGIKPIGKAHQRAESKNVLRSTSAEDEAHGSNENDGGEGENTNK